jgi:heme-degrading monooxygenase HmoA
MATFGTTPHRIGVRSSGPRRAMEEVMVARTSIWKGSPEAMERWAEHVNKHVKPFVAGLPGNAGAVFLLDREEAIGMTLTLWHSEEAALVTDANAEKSRASTVAATGVELLTRGRYEVIAKVEPSSI